MKLLGYKVLRGKIVVRSGLRVGMSKDMMAIGDVDNPVIRNPLTGEPYIPGSSLKGKMRYLLEWHKGGKYIKNSTTHHVYSAADDPDVSPHEAAKDPINRIFGVAPGNKKNSLEAARLRGPTRLLVRDAYLTPESRQELFEKTSSKGSPYTEVKQEVFIPRIGGNAKPRAAERVPAGAEFDFEMVYRVVDMGDDGKMDLEYFRYVLDALRFVEVDGLGGYISRGYGQVEFRVINSNGKLVGLNEVKADDVSLVVLVKP